MADHITELGTETTKQTPQGEKTHKSRKIEIGTAIDRAKDLNKEYLTPFEHILFGSTTREVKVGDTGSGIRVNKLAFREFMEDNGSPSVMFKPREYEMRELSGSASEEDVMQKVNQERTQYPLYALDFACFIDPDDRKYIRALQNEEGLTPVVSLRPFTGGRVEGVDVHFVNREGDIVQMTKEQIDRLPISKSLRGLLRYSQLEDGGVGIDFVPPPAKPQSKTKETEEKQASGEKENNVEKYREKQRGKNEDRVIIPVPDSAKKFLEEMANQPDTDDKNKEEPIIH